MRTAKLKTRSECLFITHRLRLFCLFLFRITSFFVSPGLCILLRMSSLIVLIRVNFNQKAHALETDFRCKLSLVMSHIAYHCSASN